VGLPRTPSLSVRLDIFLRRKCVILDISLVPSNVSSHSVLKQLMGQKRRLEEIMDGPSKPHSSSPFIPMFESFRSELDEHHDRRERVIKASRDITAGSKKM